MGESSVALKATVNGLILILREEDDFQYIYDQVDKKIASAGKFFKDASISVKYRGKKLSPEEENIIQKLMTDKTGADIKSFEEELEDIQQVQKKSNGQQKSKFNIKRLVHFEGIHEGLTKFHRGTVRSGQLISSNGNAVIIGDVNPGGEIIAAGNIVIMGSLRGIVHAGADGNREAFVVALNLQPTLLRIADIITRSPDEGDNDNSLIPEIAFVKEETVYIERFLTQFK